MGAAIASADVDAVLKIAPALILASDREPLDRAARLAVRELIACDVVVWHEWTPANARLRSRMDPGALEHTETHDAFARLAPAHPIVRSHARDPSRSPLALSDFIGQRRLRGGRLYAELLRDIGDREVAVAVPTPSGVACLDLFRAGPDFSARERDRLDLLRRLIVAVETARRRGEERVAVPVLSSRQLEILGLLDAGLAPKEVGARLGISRRTVGKHLEHVYRKLDVTHLGAALALFRGGRRTADVADNGEVLPGKLADNSSRA